MSSGWNSAAYCACPVTLAGPSTRLSGVPKPARVRLVMADPLSGDAFVSDALRRSACRLIEPPHDGAAREFNLEVIGTLPLRVGQYRLRRLGKERPLRRFARQKRLGVPVAP